MKRNTFRPLPALLFLTDPVRTLDPLAAARGLPAGSAVIFRAFGQPGALAAGRALRAATRRTGVLLLVGQNATLAVRLAADGIHLPERLAGRAGWIRALRRRFLVTAAAHGLPAALRARRAGVDAALVSPVFPSRSASAGRPLGPLVFARLVRAAGLPVYALGGVTPITARALIGSGAVGLAAVEAIASLPAART